MARHTDWKIIGRGQRGWHADGMHDGNKVSGSGGTLEGYCQEAEDGTIVYDAMDADVGAFVEWVVRGPMLDCSLPNDTIDRFGDHKTLAHMLPALGGAYQTLGIMALTDKANDKRLGSFDMLSLDLYVGLFKASVPGVKWGKVVGGNVMWDTP